jgi:hypothetical protein
LPRFIVKIKDMYCEWSTNTDTPDTYLGSLEDFKEHYEERYGVEGMMLLPERLERVEKTGSSALLEMDCLDSLIAGNRAGESETALSLDEIYDNYQVPASPVEPAGLCGSEALASEED